VQELANYKADQEGPTTFRYSILPHRSFDPVAAQRFGIECSQPLIAAPARAAEPSAPALVQLDSPDVLVASLKPSEDGKAWVVRLFNPSGRPATTALRWGAIAPKALWISNLAEDRLAPLPGAVAVTPGGVITLRADLDQ
jgi:alpha-mannosidase